MKKMLERATPLITTYPLFANLLSILQLDYPRTGLWTLNHLMMMKAKLHVQNAGTNIMIDPDSAQIFCDYPFLWESPFLTIETVSREQLHLCGASPIDWIKAYITRGYYAYCYIQKSKISAYYQTSPTATHDIFLFGYDDELKVFYAADYFDQVYSMTAVPFSEFTAGFEEWIPTGRENFEELLVMSPKLTRYKQDRVSYLESTLALREYASLTISHLDEHLGLSDRASYMHPSFSYGLGVYDVLQSYLQANDTVFDWYLVDSLAFLADHKKVLMELCDFYEMPVQLKEQWKCQFQSLNRLKMVYLKHFFNGKPIPKEWLSNQVINIRNSDEAASHEMRMQLIKNINTWDTNKFQ